MQLTIETPKPFSLEQTVLLHGWVWLAPYGWDEARQTLLRLEELPSGRVVQLAIRQSRASGLTVGIEPPVALTSEDRQVIVQRLRRALSLDADLTEFAAVAKRQHAGVWRLLQAGGGRLLRGCSLYEDLVKTLFTTNAAWAYTEKMVESFCRSFGRRGSSGEGWTFPQVGAVQRSLAGQSAAASLAGKHAASPTARPWGGSSAALGVVVNTRDAASRRMQLSMTTTKVEVPSKSRASARQSKVPSGFGYRLKYLTALTERVALDSIGPTLEHPNVVATRKAELLGELPGFGSYAVNHMLVLLHHFDQLPVDREVLAYLGVAGKGAAAQQRRVELYRQRWGRWAFLGYKLERQAANRNWIGR